MKKRLAIDLDGILCEEGRVADRSMAKPILENIKLINQLYENNFIAIYTARQWDDFKMTEKWLKDNGIKYHALICGKFNYDWLFDDRTTNNISEFKNIVG